MKRIIVINNSDRALSYGIGVYTMNLIECLSRMELSFDIIYLNAEQYELNIEKKNGYRKFFIPSFPHSTDMKLSSYCQMLPFLFKELFNFDDDIIFHFNYFLPDTLIIELKKIFNCKILYTVHYTDWSFALNGDFPKLYSLLNNKKNENGISLYEKRIIDLIELDKKIFRSANLILFISQYTAMTYSQISLLSDINYTVINNGLKDEYKKITASQKKAIRQRYHIKDYETILFFAGRLDEIKGVYCLIEAFVKVIRSKPDVHLFIAGEGDFPKLLSKSRFACTQITFLGFLNKSELYNFYQIAHIGIACSIHEEFGLVALEMMMHKLPVIVTETGGLAEIVDDNVNGLKVPIVNKKGKRTVAINRLAEKISFLIDKPDECKRLGYNAREKFLSNYDLSIFSAKMNTIYNLL
ncbi:MAG: glycosyltransferase [Tannerellaceae bacterium]|jgi:glycosyltransferase|nr:glycosyltransferase [Tannerellaceae bacterium]